MKPELEQAYKEYIDFLETVISKTAAYLHFHSMPASQEDIDKGIELRAKIKSLQ